MNEEFNNQSRIVKFLFLFYLLPLIGLILYANQFVPSQKTWILLPAGLLAAVTGALVFYILVRKWERRLVESYATLNPAFQTVEDIPKPFVGKAVETPVTSTPRETSVDETTSQEELEKQRQQIESLQHDLDYKQQEINKVNKDNERYQRQAELVLQEFAQYKKAAQEQIEQKGSLLADYQQTMSEQKAVIENKQHQIAQLESKVRDLTYEIKTLLQLADIGNLPDENKSKGHFSETSQPMIEDAQLVPEAQVRSMDEAAIQLKRCVDIAQKITGSSHLSTQATSRFLGEDHLAIDYRRLFDNLRAENGATVFFYSQKENKMLFVNNQCKNLLGWNPEKFTQNFTEIIHQEEEWKNALSQLQVNAETRISMMMKTKSGSDVLVQGILGNIPTGLFKHNVVGVLFS